MAIQLFGFRLGRIEDEIKKSQNVPSFAPPTNFDGAMEVAPGGAYGTVLDLEGTAKNEAELVTRYREMSMNPECDSAIDDIVNEAITSDQNELCVSLVLDNLKLPDRVKKRIEEEFDKVLQLLDFQNIAYDVFRRWYIDGRMFYHVMIDITNPKNGIQELRYIDPRRIRKVRQPIPQTQKTVNNVIVIPAYEEYYIYSPMLTPTGTATSAPNVGIGASVPMQGIKISPDSICYVTSGIMDTRNRMVLSHLHKALKPLNQLRMLEDAVVIYRLARAPERRIFYIDVGNLPKQKAEQYVRDMMVRHKNRLVYDANTGEVQDVRKFMTMLEDYWLPRREGGRGTEITTLPGGENLGQMEDVDYFRRKLYKSLNVPITRMETDNGFSLGKASEVTRDEVKFSKFIDRLRSQFSALFDNILQTQLVLTGVMSKEEFQKYKNDIQYDFKRDNYFTELKEQEILNSRLAILGQVDSYTGKYFSVDWIRKNVLKQDEDDIENINKEIESENKIAMDNAAAANALAQPDMMDQQGSPAANKQQTPSIRNPVPKTKKVSNTAIKQTPSARREDLDINLTDDDRMLIENMTKAIDRVSKEDIIKDDL